MASRLRRMLLINTRTSGTQSSTAINEIDPTDGAAITGDNAVGKTTTMEIIPLFFGTSPSMISETAGGREPMLRFLLPSPDSAIVFEYQRGSDLERDMRCVVLRRQGASDAPEFRLLHGAFNKAFFVRDTDQGQVCNTDEEMVDAMIALGARPSLKLAINDYKHVILGTNSSSQQAGKLRQMASEHSLAQRALPHLDRLIASVVKKQVNFNDFVRVAVTIVQDKLGTPGKAQDRSRFTLKQSRSQIEQWLASRDACERALGLEPEVDHLRQSIATHDRHSDQLRHEKAVVPPMLAHAHTRLKQSNEALTRLQDRRKIQLDRENQQKSTLESDRKEADSALIRIEQEVEAEVALRDSLHLNEVQLWAADLESLPRLGELVKSTKVLIDLATGKATNIEQRFDQLAQALKREHDSRLQSLWQQETALQTQYGLEITQITEAASQQRQALAPTQEEERKDLGRRREELRGRIATAAAHVTNATASAVTQEALETARAALEEHDGRLDEIRQISENASEEARTAQTAFCQAERDDQSAKDALAAANSRLQQARELLAPADGTLLSVLRAHPDQDWKAHLARVISPSLLQRTDLQASPVDLEDQMPTLYGWHIQTAAIDIPAWADDEQLRARIELEGRSVELAQDAARQAQDALATASQQRHSNEQTATQANTALHLAIGTKTRLKNELDLAQTRQREEIRQAAELARKQVWALEEQMREMNKESASLQGRHTKQNSQIDKQAEEQQKQAQDRRDEALLNIESQRTTAATDIQSRHKQIDDQRQQQLSEAGVDTEHLNTLEKQVEETAKTMAEIEGRSPTVIRWRAWIANGGHAKLPDLQRRKELAKERFDSADKALTDHIADMEHSATAHTRDLDSANDTVSRTQDDVDLLTKLLHRLSLAEHIGSGLPSNRSATDLQASILRLEGDIETAAREIRTRFITLRDLMCESPGPVRDLVEQSLKEANSDGSAADATIAQARRLSTVHREMRRRIVPSINNSANTILESVRQFRVQIQAFETEMKRFNNALQKGLSGVHGFQRLSTVEMHMVTDFSSLGFMKGLDAVDAAAREHIARGSVFSNKTDLPDAQVSAALRQLASLLGPDSALDVNLEHHTVLRGSAHMDGKDRFFQNQNDLKHISSTGLSAILLISLLSGMLNMIRGDAPVYMPWVTDEVGMFDVKNFAALISMLKENRIDPVTASPQLSPVQYRHFGRTYTFQGQGRIARWTSESPRLSHRQKTAQGSTT